MRKYDIYIKNRKGDWEEFILKLNSWEAVKDRLEFFGSRQRYKHRIFRIYKKEKVNNYFTTKVEIEGIPETIINHKIKEDNNVCYKKEKSNTKN